MASQKRQGEELEGDITFIATPAAVPSKFGTGEDCGVEITNVRPLSFPYRVNWHQLTTISLKLTPIEVPHYP